MGEYVGLGTVKRIEAAREELVALPRQSGAFSARWKQKALSLLSRTGEMAGVRLRKPIRM
jgi:hypothetical protein